AQVEHYSGWAGALALAIIVVPVVVRSTDNMLMLVPNSLREAAAALGCPKWRIITLICYRAARSGMITGVLLAIARISGETAPLLFTALNNQFMSLNMNAPIANLPVVIFQYAASPFEDWNRLAWAGAVLITLLVLGINILARSLFRNKYAQGGAAAARNSEMTNSATADSIKLDVRNLNFYYGSFHAIKNVNMSIHQNKVTAFIGPSGCGKSTLLRTFNRMFELYPGQRAEGEILLDGQDVLASKVDISLIRAKIGMV